jgi:iron(III) transport system permease protein
VTDAVGRLAPLPTVAPRLDARWVLIGAPVALVVWLSLVPLVFLLWQSFLTPQTAGLPAQYTLENFRTAYLIPILTLSNPRSPNRGARWT